jgi:predicted acetyltransferase
MESMGVELKITLLYQLFVVNICDEQWRKVITVKGFPFSFVNPLKPLIYRPFGQKYENSAKILPPSVLPDIRQLFRNLNIPFSISFE